MECVSVSESILSTQLRLVLVMIGLQGDSNKDGNNTGSVALFCRWPENLNEHTCIWQSRDVYTIENIDSGENTRLTDSKQYNQVHAWKLPSRDVVTSSSFGHIKRIRSAMIPFNDVVKHPPLRQKWLLTRPQGPNAKGISAGVPWTTSNEHP